MKMKPIHMEFFSLLPASNVNKLCRDAHHLKISLLAKG